MASKDEPKHVFLRDIIIASPSSASASAGHLSSTEDAPASDGHLFKGGHLDLILPEAAGLELRQALGLPEDGIAVSVKCFAPHGWWVWKEDGDALHLNVPMPGLGKEHVKTQVVNDTLMIKGADDGDKGKSSGNMGASDRDKVSARYSYRIKLSTQAFKMDEIKEEMKNGLLILTVPKIKDEDRKDVFEIKIEWGMGIEWVSPRSPGCSPSRSCSPSK